MCLHLLNSTMDIVPDHLGISPSREPLRPRTASPALTMTSPLSAIIKQVRRKDSFVERADSSESIPSSHDSIYEAYYFSGTTSEDSGSRVEMSNLSRTFSTASSRPSAGNDENFKKAIALSDPLPSANTLDIGEIQFLYGHGTILQTITEQHSCGTIGTLERRRSADNLDNCMLLGYRDSHRLAKSPRRKLSFSLDDLALIKRSYHEACTTIAYEARKQLQIPEVYARPKTPVVDPPNRPSTPPGMPSWTASQNLFSSTQTRRAPQRQQTRQLGKQNRFQRFFNLSNTSYLMITGSSTSTESSTLPVRGRMAPRFRPPRSVYGPIDQHPFTRAPMAKVGEGGPLSIRTIRNAICSPPSTPSITQPSSRLPKPKRNRLGLRVRFTPSATARDSEMLSVQAAMEATSQSALHPLAPVPTSSQHRNRDANQAYIKNPCPHQKPRPRAISKLTIRPLTDITNHSASSLTTDLITIPPFTECIPLPLNFSPSQRFESVGGLRSQQDSPLKAPNCPSFAASSRGSNEALDLSLFEPIAVVQSYSSRAHIMSGALSSRSYSVSPGLESLRERGGVNVDERGSEEVEVVGGERKEASCWRCKAEGARSKVGGWWRRGGECLYVACCGFGAEEEEMEDERYGGRRFVDSLGVRRGVLESTPSGMM